MPSRSQDWLRILSLTPSRVKAYFLKPENLRDCPTSQVRTQRLRGGRGLCSQDDSPAPQLPGRREHPHGPLLCLPHLDQSVLTSAC